MDRLWHIIPTLPQVPPNTTNTANTTGDEQDDATTTSETTQQAARPSKATILAGAIDYIRMLKEERDRLVEEVEDMRDCYAHRGCPRHSGMRRKGKASEHVGFVGRGGGFP